ncbi:MAG: MFS transporter [Gemmatimonadaceae bacterium]
MTGLGQRFQGMRSGDPGRLAVLMATAFIDMVGGLMIIPLLPFYAKTLGANGFMITVLVAAFSAMQLISAPFLGRFSDRYGRKPSLLLGLAASGLAYIVFAFAQSYWLLLVSRLIQGAGGGTTGVIQAYVADAVEPKNRAKALGWLSAATNTGVVIGPLVGSAGRTLFGIHGPGLVAATLCFLNILFAFRYLTESHGAAAREKARTSRPPMVIIQRVASHPLEPAHRLIWMYAISMGAFYGVNAMLILLLNKYYGVTANTVGFFFAYVGGLSVVLRIFALGPVIDRLGEPRTNRLGVALMAIGLFVIPLTRPLALPGLASLIPLALAVALLPLGTAFMFPAVTSLLSRTVGEHERGMYMGVQQTYAGLGRVIYPLYAGWAWDHLGDRIPFWTSSLLVLSTMFLGFGMHDRIRSKTAEHPVPAEFPPPEAATE